MGGCRMKVLIILKNIILIVVSSIFLIKTFIEPKDFDEVWNTTFNFNFLRGFLVLLIIVASIELLKLAKKQHPDK